MDFSIFNKNNINYDENRNENNNLNDPNPQINNNNNEESNYIFFEDYMPSEMFELALNFSSQAHNGKNSKKIVVKVK